MHFGQTDVVVKIVQGRISECQKLGLLKNVVVGKPDARRRRGRPGKIWLDDIGEDDLETICIRN